jgi:putative DNA primase/helicase
MIGRRVLIPAIRNNVVRNLQVIEPDGATRFLTPGKTRGCYHLIGRPAAFVFAAAEFGTATDLHDATGQAVAVAFDLGNMPHVIRKLWCEFSVPVIAITPEFDGRIESAARAFGGLSVSPDLVRWRAQ